MTRFSRTGDRNNFFFRNKFVDRVNPRGTPDPGSHPDGLGVPQSLPCLESKTYHSGGGVHRKRRVGRRRWRQRREEEKGVVEGNLRLQ